MLPLPIHFTDKGYNAIEISYAANMWISQVTILNADNGIFTSFVAHSTFEGAQLCLVRAQPVYITARSYWLHITTAPCHHLAVHHTFCCRCDGERDAAPLARR